MSALPQVRTRKMVIAGGLAVAAALTILAVDTHRSTPPSDALPAAIQSVFPEPSSNVLSQASISVDLAVGYTAELEVNGFTVPEDQLYRANALNKLTFAPGRGQVIQKLLPQRNCASVKYWPISRGQDHSTSYHWCFFAS